MTCLTGRIGTNYIPAVAFVLLGVIWGSNFIYMRLAAELITPAQVTFYRVLFGFLPVFGYAVLTRSLSFSHLKYWFHFLVMSVLATSFYFFCFAKGSASLLSGLAGALSGSIPLFTFLLAVPFIADERITQRKIFGIMIGFAGVVLVANPGGEGLESSNLTGVIYMVAGALSCGASFVYARRFISPLRLPAPALTTYQLGFAVITLLLITDYDGATAVFEHMNIAVGMVLGLGVLGTGVAYILYYYIVESMGAVSAAAVTYVPPLVALFIGGCIVGESIEPLDYAATALIFAGVWLQRKG